jgi:hypothetical protein
LDIGRSKTSPWSGTRHLAPYFDDVRLEEARKELEMERDPKMKNKLEREIERLSQKIEKRRERVRRAAEGLAEESASGALIDWFRRTRFFLWAPVVVVWFMLALSAQMWLPAEIVRLGNGEGLVAFVIHDEGSWVTLLVDRDRSVRKVRQEEIISREVCELQRLSGDTSLIQLITHGKRPEVKPCTP